MLSPQSLEIEDFSGGITDFYIDAPPTFAEIMDNFFVLSNKSLLSRGGSVIDNDDDADSLIPIGYQRIGCLINYNNDNTLFVQSNQDIFYRSTVDDSYTTLLGPTSNHVFSTGSSLNYISHTEWNRHLLLCNDAFVKPQKVYKDSGGVIRVRTAGLPALATSPSIGVGSASAQNYIYAFLYHYSYTVGDQTFEDFGPTTQVAITNSSEPSVANNPITAIPVLANTTVDNYDTTVIKVFIYRTIQNGSQLFKIGEVTNGTTVFTDNVSDATCANGDPIYTAGGVLDNDPPPSAKFVHTVNGFTYWAHFTEDSQTFPNKYRQSVQLDPDSVPAGNEDEVEDEITGFSSCNNNPLIFCKKHVYRVDGFFDELGAGSMTHVPIEDAAGCISNEGIVQAEGKVFWPGNDGFYMSDGYQVQKINLHLKNSYKRWIENLSSTRKIVGRYNQFERRIYWCFQVQENATDLDSWVILDLEWGISSQSHFITSSGGDSFSPTAIEMFNKQLYRADRRGFVFIHDESYPTDPLIDTNLFPDEWGTRAIIYRYKGPAFNFGTNFVRKWVPRISLRAKNLSNVSIQINGVVDDGKAIKACKEIRWRGNFEWGDPEFVWGAVAGAACVWGGSGLIDAWRRFPKGNLRCDYFQVEITNAYSIVTNSDTLGTATFSGTANTAVLNDTDFSWPSASVGYYISTVADNYVAKWLVTNVTATTITVLDPTNTFPTGSKKWILKGYRKSEVLNVLNYAVIWAPLSMSQDQFKTNQVGNNS